MSALQPERRLIRVPAPALPAMSRWPRPGVGAWLFCLATTAYLMLAVIFVLQLHLIVGDAWSRVGNAYYTVASRDPHLAAIGFVWSPLPSLLEIPLVLLRPLWPPLVEQGYAASIISSLAMAGAVYQLHGTLADWSVPRLQRTVLAVLFAVHPMIIHYGFNGDSEALYLFFLLLSVRYLSRWVTTDSVTALVVAGIGVALSYWTRYESAVVGAAAIGVVFLVAMRRAEGPRSARILWGAADASIVGLPFVVAFLSWTAASWIIVGAPFEQFTSEYGNASQLATGVIHDLPLEPLVMVTLALAGMAPALPILGLISLGIAALRRDARWLVPVAILGSALAFAVAAWLAGKTGGWIRYYITIVPLPILLGGLILAWRPSVAGRNQMRLSRRMALASLRTTAAVVVVASLAIGIPTTWLTMTDPIVSRGGENKTIDRPQYLMGAAVSRYLDEMNLPSGSVLLDVFIGFPIALQSDHPTQFVITPDRDFKAVLADPWAFGVEYILVPPSGGLADLDAIKRHWPGIYEMGGGIATLVHEFDLGLGESFDWRLYRVDG